MTQSSVSVPAFRSAVYMATLSTIWVQKSWSEWMKRVGVLTA